MLQNVLMMFIAITMVVKEIVLGCVQEVVKVAALMHVQINVRGLVLAPVREDMKINTH